MGIYTAATDGTLLSPDFGAADTSVTIPANVFLRKTAGGNLSAATYTVDLTVRHVCRQGTQVAWSCQRYRVSLDWNTSGSDGTITAQTPTTVGPPDSSAACNTPAP